LNSVHMANTRVHYGITMTITVVTVLWHRDISDTVSVSLVAGHIGCVKGFLS